MNFIYNSYFVLHMIFIYDLCIYVSYVFHTFGNTAGEPFSVVMSLTSLAAARSVLVQEAALLSSNRLRH